MDRNIGSAGEPASTRLDLSTSGSRRCGGHGAVGVAVTLGAAGSPSTEPSVAAGTGPATTTAGVSATTTAVRGGPLLMVAEWLADSAASMRSGGFEATQMRVAGAIVR